MQREVYYLRNVLLFRYNFLIRCSRRRLCALHSPSWRPGDRLAVMSRTSLSKRAATLDGYSCAKLPLPGALTRR